MKKLLSLLLLATLISTCGQQGAEEGSRNSSAYQYSYCGQVQGSGNNLQMSSNGQFYNLTSEGQNTNILNTLAQQANTGQQTCVYTNIQPQNPQTGGYQGYSIPTIVVQSLSNAVSNSGNYIANVCGSIYRGNNYNSGNVYYIQSNGGSNTTAIVNYIIQPNNTTVTNQLYQITNQARQGCVYSNQQVSNGQYGQMIYADHVVI